MISNNKEKLGKIKNSIVNAQKVFIQSRNLAFKIIYLC